jgi:hypothetical protein
MSLYEVAGSSLGVAESSLGTSDQRHTQRRLTVIDATVNALARRLYVTVAPGATAGLPFGVSSTDQLGPGGISGDLGVLHHVAPESGC